MRRTPLLSVMLAASVAAAGVVGTGVAATTGSAAKPISAKIAGFAPKSVTVKKGVTVNWRNADKQQHNAVALSKIAGRSAFTSGAPTTGNFSAKAPRKAGTYRYICAVHPLTMKGTLVVK